MSFYFVSSVASMSVLAATIAGASTIPIKARAINKSCIIFYFLRGLPPHSAYPLMIDNIRENLNNTKNLQDEKFVLFTSNPNGAGRPKLFK